MSITNKEINYSFRYFGPYVFETKVDTISLNKIKKLCSKKNKNISDELAGIFEDQYQINANEFSKILKPYFDVWKQGADHFYARDVEPLNIDDAWVNYMKANDFNPPHIHSNFLWSSVLFLEMPDLSNERKNYKGTSPGPGSIQFDFIPTLYSKQNVVSYAKFPEVGDLIIFPSSMPHWVYPFKSKGNRISIAANFK